MARNRKPPEGEIENIRVSMLIQTERHPDIYDLFLETHGHFSHVVTDALSLYAHIRESTGAKTLVQAMGSLGLVGHSLPTQAKPNAIVKPVQSVQKPVAKKIQPESNEVGTAIKLDKEGLTESAALALANMEKDM